MLKMYTKKSQVIKLPKAPFVQASPEENGHQDIYGEFRLGFE